MGITGKKLRFIHDNYKLERKKYLLEQLKSMMAKMWIICNNALVGYARSEDTNGLSQNFIPHWTTYDGRVEFGSTFTITDTENGTLIDSNLGSRYLF